MNHVIFLLKSNVDNCLGNVFTDSVKELGFSNDDLKFWSEVYMVRNFVSMTILLKDMLIQMCDSFIGVLMLPFIENDLLVVLVQLFGKLYVFESYIFESFGQKLIRLCSEFSDGSLDSTHDRTSPSDLTCFWGHVLGDWWIVSSFIEQFLHLC